MMAAEGGLFPRGRGGAGADLLRVQYLVDCMCYYFTHHWPTEKVVEGILSSLEVIILWRLGGRLRVFKTPQRDVLCQFDEYD
jgi:hypothetical protein